MALVKSVAGKFFQQIENRVRFFFRNSVRARTTSDEISALLSHDRLVLFAHRFAKQIGLRHGISSELRCRRHHLLLINHHPIGIGRDFFQKRMQILDWRRTFLRLQELRNQLHRPWSIQRNQRHNVIELLHVEPPRQICDSSGFHLENADRFAAVIKIERFAIVQSDAF